MFNISNGFSLLNKNCRQEQEICIGLNDSNHSFNDLLSHTRLSGGGTSKRGYQTNFKLNKCNLDNGLFSEIPQLRNYKRKNFKFLLHNKIRQLENNPFIENCENPSVVLKNVVPEPHEMDPTKEHSHYFPISQEVEGTTTGYYTHRHENNPHSKKTVPSFTFNFFTDRYARFPTNFRN